MANYKPLIVSLLLCLSLIRSQGDAGSVAPSSPEPEQEVQMLRAKVASLEDEISRKDEEILQLENIVKERTAQMAALAAELDLLQKVNVADNEPVMKASTQNVLLEQQIERLASDLEDQVRKGEALEVRATEAERNSQELSHKLEIVEKTTVEKEKKIRELSAKLRQVQDKLAAVENEGRMKAEEMTKAHGMCLPHWLTMHVVRCQELASAKWHVHGRPVFDPLKQKVAQKLARGQQLVGPHLQAAQNFAKVHINSVRNTTTPYVSALAAQSASAYGVWRDAIQPYTVKAREFALHHWQESKKHTKPYVNKVVAACQPHLSTANSVVEPYLRPIASFWRWFLVSTITYHDQVQRGVKHFMEGNEILKPFSDDRLAWFTASAFFTLPMISIYKILKAAFCKKVQIKKRSGQSKKVKAKRESSERKDRRRVDS